MKHIVTAFLALALLPLPACAQARPLRDPFARPAAPPRAVEPEEEAPQVLPQLRAVMVGPRSALANINGQILAAGEWYGDYQLIRVEERGVTLNKRGVKSILVLNEASRK